MFTSSPFDGPIAQTGNCSAGRKCAGHTNQLLGGKMNSRYIEGAPFETATVRQKQLMFWCIFEGKLSSWEESGIETRRMRGLSANYLLSNGKSGRKYANLLCFHMYICICIQNIDLHTIVLSPSSHFFLSKFTFGKIAISCLHYFRYSSMTKIRKFSLKMVIWALFLRSFHVWHRISKHRPKYSTEHIFFSQNQIIFKAVQFEHRIFRMLFKISSALIN